MVHKIDEFQKLLGYQFKKEAYLITALTHSSFANENTFFENNERLEFLGDSVLGMIVAGTLYKMYPAVSEGELSKMKAALVREESLAVLAYKLKIEQYIYLGKGEERSGGKKKNSILADCFEAILGAIYLDGGFDQAKKWLNTVITKSHYESPYQVTEDYKTKLQEQAQEKPGRHVEYRLVSVEGPAHCQEFFVEALLNGEVVGNGSGSSKKAAEQEAAKNALSQL